jgi:hypothetical protein
MWRYLPPWRSPAREVASRAVGNPRDAFAGDGHRASMTIRPASQLGIAAFAEAVLILRQDPGQTVLDPAAFGGLSPLLTVVMVTVLSVAISGAILSSSLNLSPAGGNHLTIRIPFVFRYSLSGQQVTAAFLPWMILLLVVIVADTIKTPVIHEVVGELVAVSGGRFSAAQLLAALVSCPVCLLLGVTRMTLIWLIAVTCISQQAAISPHERAARLTDHDRVNPPADEAAASPASPASPQE